MTDDEGSFYRRQRERALRTVDQAGRWVNDQRAVSVPVNLAMAIYERDRDSFGSVLGSAVALRLFLFGLPLMMFLLGVTTLLVGVDILSDGFPQDVGLTGQIAAQLGDAIRSRTTTAWVLVGAGLFGSLWGGRGLTKVLAAVSATAWGLDARRSRPRLAVMGAVSGLFTVVVVAGILVDRIRASRGVVIGATSLIGVLAIYTAVWFVLSLALPRGTTDPGAVLPGAALVGLTVAVMQGISQFYLPDKIRSESALLGGIGVTAVALGWLFITGRTMVASLVVNAVVYEEIGSVSRFVFDLPVIRRIPARWTGVARFFDLPHAPERDVSPPHGPPDGTGDA